MLGAVDALLAQPLRNAARRHVARRRAAQDLWRLRARWSGTIICWRSQSNSKGRLAWPKPVGKRQCRNGPNGALAEMRRLCLSLLLWRSLLRPSPGWQIEMPGNPRADDRWRPQKRVVGMTVCWLSCETDQRGGAAPAAPSSRLPSRSAISVCEAGQPPRSCGRPPKAQGA